MEISTRVQVALVESVVCTQRCLSALSFAVAALVINWSIRSLLPRKQCPTDVPHCHFAFVQSVHGVEPSEVTSTSPPSFPLLRIASSLISQENEPWSAREELRSGRDLKKSTGVCSAATEDYGGLFRKAQEEQRRIPVIPEGKFLSINKRQF